MLTSFKDKLNAPALNSKFPFLFICFCGWLSRAGPVCIHAPFDMDTNRGGPDSHVYMMGPESDVPF